MYMKMYMYMKMRMKMSAYMYMSTSLFCAKNMKSLWKVTAFEQQNIFFQKNPHSTQQYSA